MISKSQRGLNCVYAYKHCVHTCNYCLLKVIRHRLDFIIIYIDVFTELNFILYLYIYLRMGLEKCLRALFKELKRKTFYSKSYWSTLKSNREAHFFTSK